MMNYDNIINGKEIANNLRAERNRKKMTQEEVARRLDITLRTYVSYEEDASTVKAPTLYLLSKILNCNISDFFYKPTSQNVNIVKEKQEIEVENVINDLENYLSVMNDEFYKIKNSFEKIMILSKINELVFWLEMYKEKASHNGL